jgi:hypothetical protein
MRARLVAMQPESRDRLAALTGVGFIVVGIVTFVIQGEPPAADHPGREVADWYTDNKSAIEAGAWTGLFATGLLVFFGAYLRKVLRAANGEGEMLSLVAFMGFAIVGISFAIDSTIQFALAERADDIAPTAVSALAALYDFDFMPVILGVLLFLWATGLSIVRTGVFPKWMGWVMIVFGVAAFTPVGFVSVVGSALLVVVLSLMLALRERATVAG